MIDDGASPAAAASIAASFSGIATTVSKVVTLAITDSGRPKRTLWLIVLTSRVTRVTKSPVLALSTFPRGRPSTVRTTYSRASESRSWRNSVDIHSAKKVRIACSNAPAPASASPFSVFARVPPAEAS